jgi:hypothetical protein
LEHSATKAKRGNREGQQIDHSDATVVIPVEIPEIIRIPCALKKCREELSAIDAVHVAIAVGVAKSAEEFFAVIAASGAIAIAVECDARLVVNLVAVDDERVVAVEERPADDPRTAERERRNGAAVKYRGVNVESDPAPTIMTALSKLTVMLLIFERCAWPSLMTTLSIRGAEAD